MIVDCMLLFGFAGMMGAHRKRSSFLITVMIYLGVFSLIVYFWETENGSPGILVPKFAAAYGLWTLVSLAGVCVGALAAHFTKKRS